MKVDANHKLTINEWMAVALAEMRATLDDLEAGARVAKDGGTGTNNDPRTPSIYEMVLLLSKVKKDGYKSTSMGDGSSRSARDEDGELTPPHSDPTGSAVVTPVSAKDPMLKHTQIVVNRLENIIGDLRVARGEMIQASRLGDLRPAEPGCSSCERIGSWVPMVKNSRCRWCYDFWTAEGIDPPLMILNARADGKRITRQLIDEAKRPKSKRQGRTA